jgi:transcription antitermination factor NusG
MILTNSDTMAGGDAPWYVLTVKPQHEKVVSEQLQAKGVEQYLPLFATARQWRDRIATVQLPLFPRYVFCRSTFDDRLKVLNIPGVVSIVSFGGKVCPVGSEEIDRIKALLSSGRPVRACPYAGVGQRVRICEGSLNGLEGILVREKSKYRVVVNVDLLNRGVAVEVERDMIQASATAAGA